MAAGLLPAGIEGWTTPLRMDWHRNRRLVPSTPHIQNADVQI